MNNGYKIDDQNKLYFLTLTVIEWVDVFTRQAYKEIITDSLDFCRKSKGLQLNAYVIMTNHLHLIGAARTGFQLSDIIRDFKKFTANKLLEQIKGPQESRRDWMLRRFEFAAQRNKRNSEFQFWTHENHPMELHSSKFIFQKLNYIHMNPVRAGIVTKEEDYLYSSARNYWNLSNRLEIDMFESILL